MTVAPRPPARRLRLAVIDGLRVAEAAAPALGLKSRAVLALLALSEGGRERRPRIAALLWPEAGAERGQAALRQRLRGLRGWMGEALQVERHALSLAPEGAETDLSEIFAALEAGRVAPALLEDRDPFSTLARSEAEASPAFATWVAERRQVLRRRATLKLQALAEAPDAPPDRVRDAARALLGLDPCDEAAARRLMAALAAQGEEGRALAVYDELWRRLDAERDVEPSAETQALLARILGEAPAGEASPQRSPQGRIAVVEPIAEGEARVAAAFVRVDLAERLAAFRDWRVTLDPPRPEDCRLALALAEATEGWRLTALATAADGRALGGARALLPRRDWTAALDAAAPRLVAAVALALGASEAAPELAAAAGPVASPAGEAEAASLLAKAVLRDLVPAPGALEESARRAAQAVAKDPLDARARREAAWAALLAGRREAAAEAFALAVALNPADGEGLLEAALGLAMSGRAEAAAEALAAEAALQAPRAAPGRALRALALDALDRPDAAALEEAAAEVPLAAARLAKRRAEAAARPCGPSTPTPLRPRRGPAAARGGRGDR